MNFTDTLKNSPAILTEAAIAERLRRRDDVALDPVLFNTPLIYDEHGRGCLEEIYGQYLGIAQRARLPMLICAPTWRVDRSRITLARQKTSINRDAVSFMRGLQKSWQNTDSQVFVGGLVGPANDCYSPSEALSAEDSEKYHAWQIGELAEAGVDVVVAQTFPAISEALGVIRACASAGVICIMSFVINRDGKVLDGTSIAEAIAMVDAETDKYPVGYMVNCVYPTFISAETQSKSLFERLVGIQANASSLNHAELDGSIDLRQDKLEDWGDFMVSLNRQYGVKILGGCCGTDDRYLEYVAQRLV
ncbi:homocysteine S-methyltransferase family protein [Desulfosediminicola flagellatus]|uniref:homocysteine S-methyltransferase family protein n=1 Tax=Desulfosediminicola flagellatus TaxID=2569541 RepID=UPI0010AD941E|nr:homocysteine S-methyltransferase family protein [Desulfosediminicola flagellatus]